MRPIPPPAALAAALLLAATAARADGPIEALARKAESAGGRVGVCVAAETGRLASWRADEPFPTASVAKVATAAALLAELHPEGTLATEVLAVGAVSPAGLAGDLVLVGGGDPFLVTERLYLLGREVRARGIARVQGRVILSEGRFGGGPFPASWPEEPSGEAYQPAISALGLNFNLAGVTVTPGAAAGEAAMVAPEPGVAVRGGVVTLRAGAARTLTVSPEEDGLRVGGGVPADGPPVTVRRRPGDYHAVVARAVKEVFSAAGIACGPVVWGEVPPAARPLLTFPSLPAKALTPLFLSYSNNFMAEVILRELGARRGGAPGTTEQGVRAATEILGARGFPTGGLGLADGSGLSRRSRATPAAIVELLRAVAGDWELGPAFVASLPVAGVEGTMEGRFPEARYERRIRAKTGSIDGVRTLAGFAEDAAGRRIAFCLMMDGREGFPFGETERGIMDALLAGSR